MSRDFSSEPLLSTVHNHVAPEDVRENDRVLAEIRHRDSDKELTVVRVWRISPFGIELVRPEEGPEWNYGDHIELHITLGGERTRFQGLVVHRTENTNISLFGVRFVVPDQSDHDHERRGSPRWICAEDFLPLAIAPAPGKFNYFMRFQIRNISKDGLELYTDLTNKYLLPGMILTLSMSFPLIGEATTKATIRRINIRSHGGNEKLSVGVELSGVTQATRNILSEYLIQFSNADSPNDLKTNSLGDGNFCRGVGFRFLRTEQEYERLMALRMKATFKGDTASGALNDQTCRIAIGQFRDNVVIAARVGFPNNEQPLVVEQNLQQPFQLPRRDQILEIEGVCVDQEFLGNEIVVNLLKFICSTCVTSQRPFVLLSVDVSASAPLAKLGWKPVLLNRSSKQVTYIGNAFDACVGRSANPLYWNFIWRDVSDYLLLNDIYQPVGIKKAMLRIYRAFGPISRMYFWFRRFF